MQKFSSLPMLLSCAVFVHYAAGDSLDSVRSFFGGKPYQEIIEKDYVLDLTGLITIQNIEGSITVKPGLDKRTVALRATKHANNQEHLEHMHVIEEEVSSAKLSLRSAYDYEKVKGHVDYVLTVPESVSLRLSTQAGTVHIVGVKGTITVTTVRGDITIISPEGPVHATITQQGDIVIIDPKKPVQASTHRGALYVNDSQSDVIGKTQLGQVYVQAKSVPTQAKISLANHRGDIKVKLPKQVEAEFVATTERGLVTSQQTVQVMEHQAQLEQDYWNSIKRNVRGKLGKNPQARIELQCKQGNIRIEER
jgi:hypothetical protein